jgi:plasmid stabilization system protein ParE
MWEVIWLLRAEIALQEAFEREDDRSAEAASDLLESVERVVEVIRDFPEFYREIYPPFRRAIVGKPRRFGLFYVVEPRGIIVHAFEDLRQEPERIRTKLGLPPDH